MKKIGYFLVVALLAIGIYNCSEDSPCCNHCGNRATTVATTVPVNATITGVGSLPPGVAGSIGNTRVALYISQ